MHNLVPGTKICSKNYKLGKLKAREQLKMPSGFILLVNLKCRLILI